MFHKQLSTGLTVCLVLVTSHGVFADTDKVFEGKVSDHLPSTETLGESWEFDEKMSIVIDDPDSPPEFEDERQTTRARSIAEGLTERGIRAVAFSYFVNDDSRREYVHLLVTVHEEAEPLRAEWAKDYAEDRLPKKRMAELPGLGDAAVLSTRGRHLILRAGNVHMAMRIGIKDFRYLDMISQQLEAMGFDPPDTEQVKASIEQIVEESKKR